MADTAAARSPLPRTATPVVVDTGRAAEAGRDAENPELIAALDQEFQLGGDPLRVEQYDRGRLAMLARVLTLRPRVRLRVDGIGPPLRDGSTNTGREVEAFLRELLALGVARDRIDLVTTVSTVRCPEREPFCAAGRSRVKTSLAPAKR